MNRATLLLAIVALSVPGAVSAARTHKITLEIHSAPEGAQLMINNVPSAGGMTPRTVAYEITGDCQHTQPVTVRWASGAEASTRVRLCAAVGKRQTVTLERPADVDGLAVDLQVAYQQAMLAELRAQTRALSELDYQAWLQTLNGSQRAAAAPKPFALCTTRDVARGVIYVACQ
jgi:hypothetical protein